MKTKILTVEDSKTIRMIVSKAFHAFDCEVFEAADGVQGLVLAERERPGIILLDLMMPVMDGAEMLMKLKSDQTLKSIPVIMLTAEASREHVLKIARMGVRDYLVKPFAAELLIERVRRVIDLKPRNQNSGGIRRFDDPIRILVVDDKPAIPEMIRAGVTDTTWTVTGCGQAVEAMACCEENPPDAVFASLSMPDNAASTLLQALRSNPKTRNTPVFALCVKTAAEDQLQAQQAGFTGVVTKPIDLEDLKAKLIRSLRLDTSSKYFQQRSGALWFKLPPQCSSCVASEISGHLRAKVSEAVDAGVDKLIMDLSQIKSADVNVIQLGLATIQLCEELSVKHRVVGSEATSQECKLFEESKEWRFVPSFEEALVALKEPPLAAA